MIVLENTEGKTAQGKDCKHQAKQPNVRDRSVEGRRHAFA
jgi:hypothetical protein